MSICCASLFVNELINFKKSISTKRAIIYLSLLFSILVMIVGNLPLSAEELNSYSLNSSFAEKFIEFGYYANPLLLLLSFFACFNKERPTISEGKIYPPFIIASVVLVNYLMLS